MSIDVRMKMKRIVISYGQRLFNLGWLVVGLILIAAPFSKTAVAAEVGNPAITVLVFNFRQVPAETMVKAENEAGRIFGHAGVHVTWRDCPTGDEPCQKGPGRVLILEMMADQVLDKSMDSVAGYAILSDHLAVVRYDYLPHISDGQSNSSDRARILGCIIAHEIGHLLLGPHRHSIYGIMRAHWSEEQTRRALMSQLTFLPEEAKLMQRAEQTGEQHPDAIALTSH